MKKYYLTNCSILDINTGKWLKDKAILIEDELITDIVASSEINKNLDAVDLKEEWVLPGLVDAHVHLCHEGNYNLARKFSYTESTIWATLRAAKNLTVALNSGITLLRDVGSFKRRGIKIKKVLDEGIFVGPKLISCGNLLTSPEGHVHKIGKEVCGIEICKKAVRREIRNSADFIKVTNDPVALYLEELMAIVEEEHKFRKKVSFHAFTEKSVQMALDANIDTIEHAVPFNKEMIDQMKKQKTIIVPTFYCAIETCRDIRKSMIKIEELPVFEHWLEDLKDNLPRAINSGIRIATGTDAGYPPLEFNAVIEEIKCLVNIGATPLQALQYATKLSAEACGLENIYGEIQKGKNASLIVLPENPLSNIDVLHNIKIVIKDGILIYPKEHGCLNSTPKVKCEKDLRI